MLPDNASTQICITQNEYTNATTSNFSSLGVLQNYSDGQVVSTSTVYCYRSQDVYIEYGIDIVFVVAIFIGGISFIAKRKKSSAAPLIINKEK